MIEIFTNVEWDFNHLRQVKNYVFLIKALKDLYKPNRYEKDTNRYYDRNKRYEMHVRLLIRIYSSVLVC